MLRTTRRIAVIATTATLTLVTACGGSDEGGSSASGSDATSEDVVAEATAAVEENKQGTDRALPDSSPAPLADQNIWVISCIEAGEGCAAPAAGAKEAGEALGWNVTVFDGKGSPETQSQGIRTAIADQADGIILDVVDCAPVKGALQEAKTAGVKIFAFYAFDCDDPLSGGGEPLFDATLAYQEGVSYSDANLAYDKSIIDYVIAKTDGQAKIIEFAEDDFAGAAYRHNNFTELLKACGGCEVVKQVDMTLADLGGALEAKATTALTQSPEANVVLIPYDATVTLGIGQAVVASGRNDDLLVTGGEGLTPNIGFIRDNKGQDMSVGAPARWVGWAAIDGMNRVLQGEPQVDAGIGFQTLDRDTALPEATTFYDGNIDEDGQPKQDYEANYRKIWGLS